MDIMERRDNKSFCIVVVYLELFLWYIKYYVLASTRCDGAQLRSPVLEKEVMLGVLPEQQ